MRDKRRLSAVTQRVPFYGKSVHHYSLTSLKIEIFAREISLGEATGFLYDHKGQTVLVSNWHVFSGRCARCGQPLNKYGALPESFTISFHSQAIIDCENMPAEYKFGNTPLSDDNGPLWLQHPDGQKVDVAAIPLGKLPPEVVGYAINSGAFASGPDASIGNDVYIVGFPEKFPVHLGLPIWKRGSIASETLEKDGVIFKFFVDSATKRGMSGSPVYARSRAMAEGSLQTENDEEQELYVPLGVYSGRISSSDKFSAEIGIVWPIGVVDQILTNKVRAGSYELVPNLSPKCLHNPS